MLQHKKLLYNNVHTLSGVRIRLVLTLEEASTPSEVSTSPWQTNGKTDGSCDGLKNTTQHYGVLLWFCALLTKIRLSLRIINIQLRVLWRPFLIQKELTIYECKVMLWILWIKLETNAHLCFSLVYFHYFREILSILLLHNQFIFLVVNKYFSVIS